ncbi:MAG: PAS domain S-box protein [Actinobacteria bacterium]|nr:PAS domain S-box protein [Actinomycetota bacterium]
MTLTESEERFRLLVESVREYAIFMLDAEGNIATWNAGARRIKGYDAEEIIGKHFSIFYPEKDLRAGKPEYELRVATDTGSFEDEGWRIRKDGSRFWANVVITALRDSRGFLRGFAKVTRDLTERREGELRTARALERERRTTERLRELDRLKNDFVAIVAHDLRSPMTVVQGFADMLVRDWSRLPDHQRQQFLESISRNVSNLSRLVEDVLQVARIESGELRYLIADVDLGSLAQRVVADLTPPDTPGRIHVDVERGVPSVRADERRNWEIMSNLVSNALRFSPPNKHVVIAVRSEDDMVRVSVTDYGAGIPADAFDQLFKKFSRIEDRAVKREKGTGLGLFICKQLVEAQGGSIRVDSTLGEGSIFSYTMPIRTPAESLSVLLVVEDDEDMRELIRHALDADPRIEIAGEASTAREAIDSAKEIRPGVVILDHFLEGDLMGLDAAPLIKSVSPNSKIILFTSHNLEMEAQREPAIDEFLRKEYLPKLLPVVRRLLGLQ